MASLDDRVIRAVALITQAANALRGEGEPSAPNPVTIMESTPVVPTPSSSSALNTATGATYSGGFPFRQSQPSVLNELRALASPYNRMARPRSTGGARAASAPSTPRRCFRKFLCLGGPQDVITPKSSYKTMLFEQQLGAKGFAVGVNYSSEDLRNVIEENYPKLVNQPFELLRAEDGGPSRPLRRIDTEVSIPSMIAIKTVLGPLGIVYIRPMSNMLQFREGVEEIDDSSFDETIPSSTDEEGFANRSANIATIDIEDSNASSGTGLEPSTELLATRIALVPVGSSDQDEDDSFLTHDDFRNSLYSDNPGIQPITVVRTDLVDQVLGMYLKDTSLNLKQKPKVIFIGESGVDLGGLTKEYFNQALGNVLNDKFSGSTIFEGTDDHKLPSTDPVLLRCGVFKAVGKLMAHSYMHTGVAAYGLSRAVVEYFMKNIDSQSALCIDATDIPSASEQGIISLIDRWYHVPTDNLSNEDRHALKHFALERNCDKEVLFANKSHFWELVDDSTPDEVVHLIRKWKVESQTSSLSQEEYESLKLFSASIGFYRPIIIENKFLLKEVILYNVVIASRKSQLDEMKRGLVETGVVKFLENRPYLWDAAFPNSEQLEYSVLAVLNKLEFFGEEENLIRIKIVLEDFLVTLSESGQLQVFINCVSSSPLLPSSKIGIYVGDYEFSIMTCSLKIEIPNLMPNENIINNLQLAMRFGGFGRA